MADILPSVPRCLLSLVFAAPTVTATVLCLVISDARDVALPRDA
jgi:hypothetical protein